MFFCRREVTGRRPCRGSRRKLAGRASHALSGTTMDFRRARTHIFSGVEVEEMGEMVLKVEGGWWPKKNNAVVRR